MHHKNSNGILIVCKGNICRSPFAAAFLKQAYCTLCPGVDFISSSAGTENYHVGKPADPLAIQVAGEHGIDLAGHRARQVDENDLRSASLILVMDEENLARFHERFPTFYGNLKLLGGFLKTGTSIPDPYRKDISAFRESFKLIAQCVNSMLLSQSQWVR